MWTRKITDSVSTKAKPSVPERRKSLSASQSQTQAPRRSSIGSTNGLVKSRDNVKTSDNKTKDNKPGRLTRSRSQSQPLDPSQSLVTDFSKKKN